ncbi:MAG: hypothetical protein IJW51_08235 [Clostridia bacterium]|nr:hypothetical protein [Clostridia bacterium]
MKNCKICGSLNQDSAATCAFCNSDFDPSTIVLDPKGDKEQQGESKVKKTAKILIILAIAYLMTLPIVLAIGGEFLEILPVLVICWAGFSVILLTIYTFIRKSRDNKPYDDLFYKREHYHTASEQTETAAPTVSMRSKSSFSLALYEACRQANDRISPAYDAEMSCETALARLGGLETKTARTLLAALASRRMIVLCGNESAELERALGGVAALTGETPASAKLKRGCATSEELFVAEGTAEGTAEAPKPSPFLCTLYAAHARAKSICPLVLDAESSGKLHTAIPPLRPYLENGLIDGKATVKDACRDYANITTDETVALPANTRLLLTYQPGRAALPAAALLDVCAFVNLKTVAADAAPLDKDAGVLSFDRLARLCNNAEERYYLSEDNWKKLDEIAEGLSFALGNKLATAMERFVGVYMAAGGTEQEALDAVLATLLLPATLTATAVKGEDTPALSQLLDAAFGLENLPACAETLKKFNVA